MSVIYNFVSEEQSVFFKEHSKYFVLSLYCFDESLEKMHNNANKITLSFDQTDAQGNVLKDGISFEMDMNVLSWQDVSDRQATNSDLIEDFIRHLGSSEKQWFHDQYQEAREKLTAL